MRNIAISIVILFSFSEGPNIKVMKSDSSFFALLIKVRSIKKAKEVIEKSGFETINATQGLKILNYTSDIGLIFFE